MTHTATAAAPARIPAIGDRVIIDALLMGKTIPLEVIVAQVDDEGPRGIRIICRPEGSLVTAFARYEWREVA